MIVGIALALGAVCWGVLIVSERARSRLRSSPTAPAANNTPTYADATLTSPERFGAVLGSAALLFFLGYLFYKSIPVSAAVSLLALFAPKLFGKRKALRRKDMLRQHFKQTLQSLSASLSAGKSLENAFRSARDDLRLIYPDGTVDMIAELDAVVRRLDNGETLERCLLDLAHRSNVPDISQFAEIVSVGKRTGGDLLEVLRRTSDLIGDKLEVEQDIAVMVAQKRFEARALCVIPPGLIAFLAFGSPDYMEPLYVQGGRWIMTLIGLGMAGCMWWMNALFRLRM